MMSALVAAFVVALLGAPAPLPTQQWSAEQQEVWEFELSCQESKQAWIDCFHEDYVAWGNMNLGVPITKSDHIAMGLRGWDVNERLIVHLKPLEITVRGNFAVALVVYTTTVRNGDTGEVTTQSMAWTDVCVKENGRWYWIADHGTLVDGG
jgi:hypothetical protein